MPEMYMPKTEAATMQSDWVAAELTGAQVAAFTNDFAPDENTVWSDLVEPVAAFYAQKDAIFGQPYENADGSVSLEMQSVQWDCVASSVTELWRGIAVVTPSVIRILGVARADADKTMATDLDSFVASGYRLTLTPPAPTT